MVLVMAEGRHINEGGGRRRRTVAAAAEKEGKEKAKCVKPGFIFASTCRRRSSDCCLLVGGRKIAKGQAESQWP